MTDINGNKVEVGTHVRVIDAAGIERLLTVRRFNTDGDAWANDGEGNAWKLAMWLRKGDKVEVIE